MEELDSEIDSMDFLFIWYEFKCCHCSNSKDKIGLKLYTREMSTSLFYRIDKVCMLKTQV
jgi:hypothetical protein